MKYLPEDLKKEYEFLTKNNPDIPELKSPLINLSDTFRAYFILAHYFTDSSSAQEAERMLIGVRSVDLLASALGRQIVSYGGRRKYSNPLDICATLFFGLVKNHSFSDGNKRTALLVLLYQLQLYGYYPTSPKKEFERLVLSVADNSIPTKYASYYKRFKKDDDPIIRTIAYILKRMVVKKDNSYHISPTMKDFCAALESFGVECTQENGKIKLQYTIPAKWFFFPPQTATFTIPFGGWTRVVGAKTARDTLQALGLYDQFATYKDLLSGADPFYELTDTFQEPLRRLKDE